MYKANAKKRGILVELSFEQFEALIEQPCHYCGSGPASHGIDRIDNTKGYIQGNVASCCATCNGMKSDLALDAWIAHLRVVVSRFP